MIVNLKEINMTLNSLTQITVPFHSAELYLVEHNGQPYVPMRSIVQGMGLDWKSQFVKLKQRFSTCVVEITMQILGDDQARLHTCLLLRKLPAWLYSIHANKVKPELRETVIMYQNECDDVLWDYWTKGQAINQRKAISPEQQALLHEIVARRSNGERKIYAEMWARHNRHFKIAKYSQLLAVHFPEAVHYLETMDLKRKLAAKGSENKALDLLDAEITNKVHDYVWALQREIGRLGGKVEKFPEFDKETIVRAVVTRMVDQSRMLLTLNRSTGRPEISLIPSNSWILSSANIASIIGDPCGPSKELLPDIIHAAVKRLGG